MERVKAYQPKKISFGFSFYSLLLYKQISHKLLVMLCFTLWPLLHIFIYKYTYRYMSVCINKYFNLNSLSNNLYSQREKTKTSESKYKNMFLRN